MSILSGSADAIKYILFFFNVVFMVTGVILISVGGAVATIYGEYDVFLVSKFFSIPTFLIVIGSFIIIIGLFGCFGAIKENYCLILTFCILLALIFILELAAGISGYVLRSDAEKYIRVTLNNSMSVYEKNSAKPNDVVILWDYVQETFTCCGVDGYQNWSRYYKEKLPMSCCKIPNGAVGNFNCTIDTDKNYRYNIGCLKEFSNFIAAHAVSLGAAGIIIAFIQFFGVIFAGYIAREVKIRNGITGWM